VVDLAALDLPRRLRHLTAVTMRGVARLTSPGSLNAFACVSEALVTRGDRGIGVVDADSDVVV
jgi:hypothetical protein